MVQRAERSNFWIWVIVKFHACIVTLLQLWLLPLWFISFDMVYFEFLDHRCNRRNPNLAEFPENVKLFAYSVASAPGKVLITGGYIILERPNAGLVLSTNARFYAIVKPLYDEIKPDSWAWVSPDYTFGVLLDNSIPCSFLEPAWKCFLLVWLWALLSLWFLKIWGCLVQIIIAGFLVVVHIGKIYSLFFQCSCFLDFFFMLCGKFSQNDVKFEECRPE